MTRYTRAAAVLGAAVALGACSTNSLTPAPASSGVSTIPVGLSTQWAGTINPLMGSNIKGSVAAVSGVNGTARTNVSVNVTGVVPGEAHPWHIHAGQCGDNGPILGDPKAYPPLKASADSAAGTTATIAADLVTGTRYYVNIHRSASEMGVIVACGDLMRSGS